VSAYVPRRSRALGWLLASLLAGAAFGMDLPPAGKIRTAFDAVDASRRGTIDSGKWDEASFALFRAADRNNDDFIDREELRAGNMAPDTFLRADFNRDERLSVGEFTELRRAMFHTADIDRDDRLTRAEFELLILMERVGWQDANQNGRIEMSELMSSLLLAFGGLDTDADAALSETEAAYMRPEAFRRYDTDRNGRLSRDEFVQGYRTEMIAG
jgi:Ca2+-binding EF-hand superfamily protein